MSRPASKKVPRKERAIVRRMLTVYDGQRMLGSIEEGRTCLARDPDGGVIGTYASRKEAVRATSAVNADRMTAP